MPISKNKFPFEASGLRNVFRTFSELRAFLPGPTIQAMAQSWRPYRPIFPSRTAFQRPFRPIFPSKTTFRRPYRPIFLSRTPFRRPYRPIFPSRTPFWRPYRPIFPSRTPFWRPYRPIFPSKKTFWRPYRPTFLSKDHILIEFVFEILDLTCMADLHTSSSTKLRNNFVAGPL